jgi:hypothetical protein
MDYKALNLSPEEWQVLSRLPIEVAAAATVADSTRGAGSTRELLAALSTLLAGVKLLRHNELVQTVFDAYKLDGHGEAEILQLSQDPPPDLVENTLSLVRQANEILAGRPDQDAATEFKLWLRGVAAEIISSSASGGFLGFGGRSVTDEEVSFLDRLTKALGLEVVSGDDSTP